MTRYSAWLVILGSSLWATDTLFRRPLTGDLSPVTIVLAEHCVLAIATLPVVWCRRKEFLNLKGREYISLIFIALGGSVVATVLFTIAIKYGNPSVAILLQKSQPLFTVLLARFALGERPAKWFWPCLATAIGGGYLMSAAGSNMDPAPDSGHPMIAFCAIGAAGLWGCATVCGRYLVAKISTSFLTALRFLFALPMLLVLYLFLPEAQRGLPSGLPTISAVIGMALIPGLLAMLIYYKGLQSTSASNASICELAFPVTAVVVNWVILGVHLSVVQLFGSGLLIASVTVLAWMRTPLAERAPTASSKPILP